MCSNGHRFRALPPGLCLKQRRGPLRSGARWSLSPLYPLSGRLATAHSRLTERGRWPRPCWVPGAPARRQGVPAVDSGQWAMAHLRSGAALAAKNSAAPLAWQLECLRSRKAGEDLDALAERLAGLTPGAFSALSRRTVALFGPQSLRWRAPRRGTEPRPRGCGEAGACRARMVTLGGAALRHSDSTSQCAPVAPRPLRSCAFPSPPPRRCVGIRSALARPVLLLWLSLSRLSTHTRPTLLSQPLRAPQTPLIPTTHCWPRSDCSARATDRRASSHSLRLSHVLHPR